MLILSFVLLVSLLGCSAHLVPLNIAKTLPLKPLSKRNVCDLNDQSTSPIMYHEYTMADCPPSNVMDSNGNCPIVPAFLPSCTAFCEVRTDFFYAQEQPVVNSYCRGPFSCTITDSKTTTWSWTGNANIACDITQALKVGITGGFMVASANMRSTALKVDLERGKCGYFTILPMVKGACGTLTRWTACTNPTPELVTTTINYCVQQPMTAAGQGLSITTFVEVDCVSLQPLDPKIQPDPLFAAHPELLLDRGVVADMLNQFTVSIAQGGLISGSALDPNGGQGIAGSG